MKWHGTTLALQPVSYSYSPSEGYTLLPVHEGSKEAVSALAARYRQYRIPFHVQGDDGKYTIRAEQITPDSQTETPTGTWELVGEPEMADIRESDAYRALSADQQQFISERIDGIIDFSATEAEEGVVWHDEYTFSLDGNALVLYDMVCKGQTHYFRTNYVLRHIQTVSQGYQSALSGSNIGKVYSKAQLIAECQKFGDQSIIPLMVAEINTIPPRTPPNDNYVWGWLKQAPTLRVTAGDRIECSVEYILEMWPVILYPAVE